MIVNLVLRLVWSIVNSVLFSVGQAPDRVPAGSVIFPLNRVRAQEQWNHAKDRHRAADQDDESFAVIHKLDGDDFTSLSKPMASAIIGPRCL